VPEATSPRLLVSASSFRLLASHRPGLFRALQREGFAVIAAAPEGSGKDELKDMGVAVEVVAMQPTARSPLADVDLWRRYVALLRRVRPDAFLGFTAKPNIYGSLAAQSLGIPTINNISGLGRVFASRSLLTRLVERLYQLAFRRAPVVFFENRDDSTLFVERGIVRPEQVVNLPGAGLDLDHYAPAAENMDRESEGLIFLLAGRLLWDKGVQQFVDAAQMVRQRHPATRFQILGFVEPPDRSAVPGETLEQWDREGAVEYLGSTGDVRPFIAAADCVVLPSYYREGVPRILMEAAAMGKPLITTDAPGCRDAVDDGVTGYLCEPRSASAVAEAMERLAGLSADERAGMGAAGRAKMEREFSAEVVHRAYLDALRKLGVRSGKSYSE
jgi:glycosyltransferase involved in cell wall biosynthesis